MKTCVVIPAYNEESTIKEVINDVLYFADAVIVVDDGSTDRTFDIAEGIEDVYVLKHIINRGYGAATKTGLDYALLMGFDITITFDADGQHHASDIPDLIEPIEKDEADVVLGTRFHKNALKIPGFRKWSIKLAIFFTRIMSGLKVSDTHNGLKAFSRRALRKIDIRQRGMSAASEILDEIARHKLLFKEVPVVVEYTKYSKEKNSRQGTFKKISLAVDFIAGKIINIYHK